MYPQSLLVLAAFSCCCYAQQAASDVVKSIDGITQGLQDAKDLANAVSSTEETEVCEANRVPSLLNRAS